MNLVIAIVFFFVVASFSAFVNYAVKPPKIISDITPQHFGLSYETVSFQTKDGLSLQGWFIPRQPSSESTTPTAPKTIVALHGWPADKGDVLPLISFLAQDYNLFLFDFRALGRSEGKYSTFGAKEVEDLRAALRYLELRGIHEVGVWGFSMGGATALMTAPDTLQIKAVVADSSYARLDWVATGAFQLPVLRHPLGFFLRLWGIVFFGIDSKDVAPLEAAKKLEIPVLIIHSQDDEVIPFSHAFALKTALQHNLKAEFWFQERLLHGQLDGEYTARVQEFFQKNLER